MSLILDDPRDTCLSHGDDPSGDTEPPVKQDAHAGVKLKLLSVYMALTPVGVSLHIDADIEHLVLSGKLFGTNTDSRSSSPERSPSPTFSFASTSTSSDASHPTPTPMDHINSSNNPNNKNQSEWAQDAQASKASSTTHTKQPPSKPRGAHAGWRKCAGGWRGLILPKMQMQIWTPTDQKNALTSSVCPNQAALGNTDRATNLFHTLFHSAFFLSESCSDNALCRQSNDCPSDPLSADCDNLKGIDQGARASIHVLCETPSATHPGHRSFIRPRSTSHTYPQKYGS
ncbi:hypothetical protein CY34DRAFT_18493 [Suillus luteus UH-Slu-Lm8-n1]|uniref:Uncharacterized protein n=1 Tax=Suillus luteus UH-Slu-Lm8-n1 TaxID=930992 RepID=A0A0D0A4R7_9AGAM|nr:hypothetical protein CY34DRAFT_18493 [Suillus luteus UH-Slu-Lm8-n1]